MKLKNKETGEIKDWSFAMLQNVMQSTERKHYGSLAELNAEWEDYEEPKVAYWIDSQGDICVFSDTEVDDWTKEKQIGNYFETKEEAEAAVEKLRAWKRLKDKGFGFYGYNFHDVLFGVINIKAEFENSSDTQIAKDLDLLFGGEDE